MELSNNVQMLTAGQLAVKLAISKRQVWRMVAEGRLPPPIRILRVVRWPNEIIANWIEAGCPAHSEGRDLHEPRVKEVFARAIMKASDSPREEGGVAS